MNEQLPANNPIESLEKRKERKEKLRLEITSFAAEIIASGETFPFPGLDNETYVKWKESEEFIPSEFAFTSIDEILEKFKTEGMKLSLGDVYPADAKHNGAVYVLPVSSTSVKEDGLLLKKIIIDGSADPRIKNLFSKVEEYEKINVRAD
ncbi:MAG: hypothetical protein JWM20_906 [Patescibacteria group bacterium]|nr:hypothetical protein [Patescibacteria group bacterium]